MNKEEAMQMLDTFIDCLYTNLTEERYQELKAAIKALYAQRETSVVRKLPSAQPWIPCSDRLPEYEDLYLTTTEHGSVYCDFYDGYRFNRTEKVIAWMTLPEPYKGK